jgi:hypothetical protein
MRSIDRRAAIVGAMEREQTVQQENSLMLQSSALPVGPEKSRSKLSVRDDVDLSEWYLSQRWSDGLPVVPPTPDKIAAMVSALGGEPQFVECKIPPRLGGRHCSIHASASASALAILENPPLQPSS